LDFTLLLIQRDHPPREITLKKRGRVVIGRQPDCQIRLPDSGVSRQHCELLLDSGSPVLKDLGSSNGTYVNRRRISQTELSAGDLIAIGPFVFVAKIDGMPADIDPAQAIDEGAMSESGPRLVDGDEPKTPLRGGGASSGSSVGGSGSGVGAGVGGKKAPAPGRMKSLTDEDPPTKASGSDDSDEFDFDFLGDDKDAPKL
jgi:hypothetical protein